MFIFYWLFRAARWLRLKRHFLHRVLWPNKHPPCFGKRRPQQQKSPVYYHRQPKPEWVRREIIRLKALMPDAGCRSIAMIFNRRFKLSKNMTVCKTYVSDTVRAHQYDIQVLRRNMKHRKPKGISGNLIWGLDLTGKTDTGGQSHTILGILEHSSRAILTLAAIKNKTTLTLLRYLLRH